MPLAISTHGGKRDLLRELQTHNVAFLIVGGAAVAFHGCRNETHFDEVDLLLDPTTENAACAISALTAAGLGVLFSIGNLAKPRARVPVHTSEYDVDILTPRPDKIFADLLARSIPGELNDLSVRVIARCDLIVMKQIAVEESSEPTKHKLDLECLKDCVRHDFG